MRPLPLLLALLALTTGLRADFQAGTALIDITPERLPVIVNGGMTSRSVDKVKTRLHARAFAFSDGRERLAIVVVDSCMLPRPLVDEAKGAASAEADRLVAAARDTITIDTARARGELRAEVASLVVQGAGQLLGREVNAAAHADLLERLAAQIEQGAAAK